MCTLFAMNLELQVDIHFPLEEAKEKKTGSEPYIIMLCVFSWLLDTKWKRRLCRL